MLWMSEVLRDLNHYMLIHICIHTGYWIPIHDSDVTWTSWNLKSPATRLFVQATVKENVKASHYQLSVEGNYGWPVDSHNKWLIKRKEFPFHSIMKLCVFGIYASFDIVYMYMHDKWKQRRSVYNSCFINRQQTDSTTSALTTYCFRSTTIPQHLAWYGNSTWVPPGIYNSPYAIQHANHGNTLI